MFIQLVIYLPCPSYLNAASQINLCMLETYINMAGKCSANFLIKRHWLLIHIAFSLAFLFQFVSIVDDLLYPTQTTTSTENQMVDQLPVLFKICVNPGLNISKIKEEGYLHTYKYFLGISKYNSTNYGWSGHTNTSGGMGSTVRGRIRRNLIL